MDNKCKGIPRYLFRTYSPGSDGLHSSSGFVSMAKAHGMTSITSLRECTKDEARGMITDHVTWKSWKVREDDILISFTSSFLFALLHGLRKVEKRFKTTLSNCYIAIIDTREYPDGTFQWTPDLLLQYDLDEGTDRLLHREYHLAEYLAEFELLTLSSAASISVSLETLITQGGLFKIMPELNEEPCRGNLVKSLSHLRFKWYDEIVPVKPSEMEEARTCALCFGGKWLCPMMIWVLAMKARSDDDEVLHKDFQDGWHGMVDYPYLYDKKDEEPPPSLKELKQWARIMHVVWSSQTACKEEDLDGLIEGVSGLGLPGTDEEAAFS